MVLIRHLVFSDTPLAIFRWRLRRSSFLVLPLRLPCYVDCMSLVSRVVVFAVLFVLLLTDSTKAKAAAPGTPETILGISGSHFTIQGVPTFLLGASYYGALGASEETIQQDLKDLQAHGFNWIRVWATWSAYATNVSAVDSHGKAREPFLSRLAWLVAECDRRHVIVDVSLSRGDAGELQTLEAHQQAVITLVKALRPARNWYLDLANERNIRDQRYVSVQELRTLRDTAKELAPKLLITASHAGGDLGHEDLRRYLQEAQLDFLTPHRPREADSAAQTSAKTVQMLGWMRELGRTVPIHYQEPFRRGYAGWEPRAADFTADLEASRHSGAAGWCFHNGGTRTKPEERPRRSFDLRDGPLFAQLDEEERLFLVSLKNLAAETTSARPTQPWPQATPSEVGLDEAKLKAYSDSIGGRGCVVRAGQLVYTWGDATRPGDVASAVKPWFTHFLLRAIEDGRIPSLDQRVLEWEPKLATLNTNLGSKDANITWRHLANQTSCYGLTERPGTAFCYNDWQMALFVDLLFGKVYGTAWKEVDTKVLHPLLTDLLGCEDHPSLTAFGAAERAGRLAISPRDFARFGQLYLQGGNWHGRQLIGNDLATMAISSPLPAFLPRAGMEAADMLPGQRTLGSQRIPDNQTEHFGSYSWLWWVNGMEKNGNRHWPSAPPDLFAALGHGGIRGMAVFPSLKLIVSWNDTNTDSPTKENEAFRVLLQAVRETHQERSKASTNGH